MILKRNKKVLFIFFRYVIFVTTLFLFSCGNSSDENCIVNTYTNYLKKSYPQPTENTWQDCEWIELFRYKTNGTSGNVYSNIQKIYKKNNRLLLLHMFGIDEISLEKKKITPHFRFLSPVTGRIADNGDYILFQQAIGSPNRPMAYFREVSPRFALLSYDATSGILLNNTSISLLVEQNNVAYFLDLESEKTICHKSSFFSQYFKSKPLKLIAVSPSNRYILAENGNYNGERKISILDLKEQKVIKDWTDGKFLNLGNSMFVNEQTIVANMSTRFYLWKFATSDHARYIDFTEPITDLKILNEREVIIITDRTLRLIDLKELRVMKTKTIERINPKSAWRFYWESNLLVLFDGGELVFFSCKP